jgi:sugar phosphate isomerase/epimerase
MRIGVNDRLDYQNADEWIKLIKELNASTVIAPMKYSDSREVKKSYLDYVRKYQLVIGEVGIWRNPMSPDEKERKDALAFSREQLALADEIQANCCVNIVGAVGSNWAGYYPENYSEDTYALIIDTIRGIIDAVKPRHTYYAIEPMQWMHPDSPEDYLKLMKDIDRKEVAVHMDYANMINGIDRYHHRKEFVEECFRKLGPYIRSIHAKDVHLGDESPCCLREVVPGEGGIDYAQILRLSHALGPDIPVFVEHLGDYGKYLNAIRYLRNIGESNGIDIITVNW